MYMCVCILVQVYKANCSSTLLLHVHVALSSSCYYEALIAMFYCGH